MAKELGPKGLEIICFPCNQFGAQESGSPEEIRAFADNYGATCAAAALRQLRTCCADRTHHVWTQLSDVRQG